MRRLKHYNLDAIISVGYRVNTRRGVRFRQWATSTLHGHLVRGLTMSERRLPVGRRCPEPLGLTVGTTWTAITKTRMLSLLGISCSISIAHSRKRGTTGRWHGALTPRVMQPAFEDADVLGTPGLTMAYLDASHSSSGALDGLDMVRPA